VPSQRSSPVLLTLLAFDAERLWKRVLPVHHYAEGLPDGRVAVLTSRSRRIPELFDEMAAIDNGLAILSADGRSIEQERSLYDMLVKNPDILELRMFGEGDPKLRRDFLHANFFQWMPGGALEVVSRCLPRSAVPVTEDLEALDPPEVLLVGGDDR